MAACELRGKLKFKNGGTKDFVIKAENSLKSILSGVRKLNADVSEVLTELVSQEKLSAGIGKGDVVLNDEGEDDSDEEEETHLKVKNNGSNAEPPAKRTKTLRP